MTRTFFLLLAAAALVGCEVAQGAVDNATRSQARKAVNSSLAKRAPNVDLSPVTDCVINNASSKEILKLAGKTVTGVDQETATLVLEIVSRPETLRCIASSGFNPLDLG